MDSYKKLQYAEHALSQINASFHSNQKDLNHSQENEKGISQNHQQENNIELSGLHSNISEKSLPEEE